MIRVSNGGELIRIEKAFILEVFKLNLIANKSINFESFKQKYQQDRSSFSDHWLPRYKVKGFDRKSIKIPPNEAWIPLEITSSKHTMLYAKSWEGIHKQIFQSPYVHGSGHSKPPHQY